MPKIKPSLLFAICAWSLLILRFGYRYGTGDQVELLPYTLFLHNPALYPHDFFIHGLNASVPNERTVMAWLLLPFVNHLEVFCFLFQFFSTIFLVMGLERLAAKFINNRYLVWLAVLTALIPLNDFAMGNVELYSECLQASSVATAIVVWALNFFLEEQFVYASLLLSIASIIQLLEGLDVMMVLSALLFLSFLRHRVPIAIGTASEAIPPPLQVIAPRRGGARAKQSHSIKAQTLISFITIYALTAGIYLVWVFAVKTGSQTADCKPLANAELFKVLFQFRHPHHFILAHFPKLKMIVFFILCAFALRFYKMRSHTLFSFFVICIIGLGIYAVATDVFHFIFLANFQFYKVTQWMKFLGVVAVIGLIEPIMVSRYAWFRICADKAALVIVSVFSWLIIIFFNQHLPYHVPYQLFGMKEKDDMINICQQVRDSTPPDAVFIQPFDNTELKFYAQRSSFVEFKANVRHKCFVGEWYRRVQLVFNVSAGDSAKGFNLQQQADAHYYDLSLHELAILRREGVTHMLVKKDMHPHEGSLILSNGTYAVYKL